jgi:3-oxoacyl-[acyl-carrier protein] reductase
MAGNQGSPPRVAIVTGGSRGIGRRCVERLADDGASIVVGFGTNEAEAHAAVAAAEGKGARAVAVRADVADAREVTELFDGAVHAFGAVDTTTYAATKGAVEAMTLILAAELGERDINVNAVAPGPTATAMFLEGKDDETIAGFAGAIPFGRIGTATEIAEAVAFLTSPAGHWVNGQILRANGGINEARRRSPWPAPRRGGRRGPRCGRWRRH